MRNDPLRGCSLNPEPVIWFFGACLTILVLILDPHVSMAHEGDEVAPIQEVIGDVGDAGLKPLALEGLDIHGFQGIRIVDEGLEVDGYDANERLQ